MKYIFDQIISSLLFVLFFILYLALSFGAVSLAVWIILELLGQEFSVEVAVAIWLLWMSLIK